jgi:hypothetical protein
MRGGGRMRENNGGMNLIKIYGKLWGVEYEKPMRT